MAEQDETTGRFARLEERVDNVITNQADHGRNDEKRFDKIESKLDALVVKVATMAGLGGVVGAVLSHFLGNAQ